jgi:tetratricopeptide (TPR) repeat protein
LLDGLPLAIAQAAAFLQETGIGLQKYIEFYEQKWKELMESRGLEEDRLQDYPDRSVWTTWTLSYNAIRDKNAAAANLLLLWAFLDGKDLWHGLFAAACNASTAVSSSLSEWIGDIAGNELEFTKAIGLLRNYSLIESVQGQGSYATHPVVHRWAYYFQDGDDSRAQLTQLAVMVVGWAVPDSSSQDYSILQRRILPHAQVCSRWVGSIETKQSTTHKGGVTKVKLSEDRVLIDAVHRLGFLYAHQGKLVEAEQMYQRALQGKEKAWGPEHTSTLDTVNNLGLLYKKQGKLVEAEQMYQRALQGYEKAWGPEHTSTLSTVNNLGLLYADQGKLVEAEQMYQRALQGYEKAWGPEHTSTLDTVNNLGNLYTSQGKLVEAEQMYQQAIQGYEKALGTNIITYVPALNTMWCLGSLFAIQADIAKARTMYSKALLGYEQVFGPKHAESKTLRERLYALDAVVQKKAPVETEERAEDLQVGLSHLGIEKNTSRSKRRKLL